MAEKKKCMVCGTTYSFCSHCTNVTVDDLWRNSYCSTDCRDIFKLCRRYNGKDISADEACELLEQYHYADKDIKEPVKSKINEILSQRTKVDVVAEEPKVEEKEIPEEVSEYEEKPKYERPRRRRIKKSEVE